MSTVAGDTSTGGNNNVDGNTNDHANQTPGHIVSMRRNQGCRNPGQDTTVRFKGNIEGLATLGKREERKVDLFLVFQREMHDHIVAIYKHSSDISYLVTTIQNPVPRLTKQMSNISKLKTEWGIDSSLTSYNQEQQDIINELQELLGPERKAFVERKFFLKQNIS